MTAGPQRIWQAGMRRIILLTALAAIAFGAFVYGIVLNGFGLFEDPGRNRVVASEPPPPPAPPAPAPESAGDENGSADGEQPAAASAPETPTPAAPRTAEIPVQGGHDEPASAESRVARDVTPPNVLSRPTSRYVDPATVEEVREEEQPDVRRYHRVVVRDARTLQSGDKTIRLAGISPLPAEKTCTDETGQEWPCGRVAAAALRMLIRHRALDCAIVSESGGEIVGTCSAGLQDINGWLVEQGWAEANPGAGYGTEAEAARSEKRGLYLAKWEAKGTGGSGVVPQSSFTAPALPAEPYPSAPLPAAPSGQGALESPAN